MKELFLKRSLDRIKKEKVHIIDLLCNEWGVEPTLQKIDIIYNRELPYTIIIDDDKKFLYKSNIAKRTPNIVSFDDIKIDFEKCFESTLLPNILNESLNFYEVEYFNNIDYKNLTLSNLNIFRKEINKTKILNYCETIENNTYCFIDFDLQNFYYNIHTNEIRLTYSGDMDILDFFNPNILSIDNPNNKSTFFIMKNVDLPKYNLSNDEYIKKIDHVYPSIDCDIKFIM